MASLGNNAGVLYMQHMQSELPVLHRVMMMTSGRCLVHEYKCSFNDNDNDNNNIIIMFLCDL
jgi:hypothetical protein